MSQTFNVAPRKQRGVVCVVLIVLTVAVFWQVKDHPFITFDDDVYVTDNRHVQEGLTPSGVVWAFTTMEAEFWHPLTWLSLMLDAQLFGLNPNGFHVTNLILHLLSTLLLFALFFRLTKALWPSAFVAAVFGIHPLHVESVAWVAQRKDMVSGFFWMLTLYFYVWYTEKPHWRRYAAVLISFACGLMSKSIVITLPIVMLLLDYWPLGRLRRKWGASPDAEKTRKISGRPSPENAKVGRRVFPATDTSLPPSIGIIPVWQIQEKAPFFFLSVVFAGLTLYAQDVMTLASWPFGSRIANAFVSYMRYVAHVFYPLGLAVFYPFVADLSAWKIVLGVVFFLGATAAAILGYRRFPALLVGWFWYVIVLMPVIGVVQVGKHAWADRYAYLSSIGITIVLAWVLPEFFKRGPFSKKMIGWVGAIFVAAMAVLAWRQVGFWQSSITLYERALRVTEKNTLAHYNLANALADHGRLEEAKMHFREAIRISPSAYEARVNLGVVLAMEGRHEEAIRWYREAIGIEPGDAVTYCNLGSAYSDTGRDKEAQEAYLKALALDPDYADAHCNYAHLLKKQNKMDEALKHYRRALQLNPDHAEANQAMGEYFDAQNQSADAVRHYLIVIKTKPADFRLLNNLAVHLDRLGRYTEAIDYYRRALDVDPGHPGVHYNLALALIRQSDLVTARFHLRRAVELRADFIPARQALKTLEDALARQAR